MHKARAFFFVCAGVFLLALAYHLGATSAQAQYGATVTGFAVTSGPYGYVMTPNGDVYQRYLADPAAPASRMCNYWGGGPTPTEPQTVGQLKVKYR